MIKATHALLMVSGVLGNNNSDKESGDMTNDAKNALLAIFQKVAYVDNDGQSYYNELQEALFNVTVLSITAVFEQGTAVIYTDDTLDDLKEYLTVTANYDDGTTGTVTTYELSGTLTAGTSTITVTYSDKTTTFNVTVVAPLYSIPDFAAQTVSGGSGRTYTVSKSNGYYTISGTGNAAVYVDQYGVVSATRPTSAWFSTTAGQELLQKINDITWSNPTSAAITLNYKFCRSDADGNIYSEDYPMAANGSGSDAEHTHTIAAITSGRSISGVVFQFTSNAGTSANVTATFKIKLFLDGVRYL